MAVTLTSRTSAHSVTTTVAPFRAWRGSRLAVARGPVRATIEAQDYHGFTAQVQQLFDQKAPQSQIKTNPAKIKIAHKLITFNVVKFHRFVTLQLDLSNKTIKTDFYKCVTPQQPPRPTRQLIHTLDLIPSKRWQPYYC